MTEDQVQVRERFAPAALICAVFANLHRDEETKPEPFTIADFMPGSKESERDSLVAFAEAIAAGEIFEADPKEFAIFKKEFNENFEVN